jgi:hypothetical protein
MARQSRRTGIIENLIAEARAAEWDFDSWCCASGYDVRDPYARRIFECLLAYAKRERGVGLH